MSARSSVSASSSTRSAHARTAAHLSAAFSSDVVETFKSAPKWNAWPLEPPPELVQIDGWRYRIVLTCENGHATEREEVRFRNEAR